MSRQPALNMTLQVLGGTPLPDLPWTGMQGHLLNDPRHDELFQPGQKALLVSQFCVAATDVLAVLSGQRDTSSDAMRLPYLFAAGTKLLMSCHHTALNAFQIV